MITTFVTVVVLVLSGFVLGFFTASWGECPKCHERQAAADAELERLRSDFEWADKGVDAKHV